MSNTIPRKMRISRKSKLVMKSRQRTIKQWSSRNISCFQPNHFICHSFLIHVREMHPKIWILVWIMTKRQILILLWWGFWYLLVSSFIVIPLLQISLADLQTISLLEYSFTIELLLQCLLNSLETSPRDIFFRFFFS